MGYKKLENRIQGAQVPVNSCYKWFNTVMNSQPKDPIHELIVIQCLIMSLVQRQARYRDKIEIPLKLNIPMMNKLVYSHVISAYTSFPQLPEPVGGCINWMSQNLFRWDIGIIERKAKLD